jgi:hypothetical protein
MGADGQKGLFIYLFIYLFIKVFSGVCAWKRNFWVLHQFFQGCEAICTEGAAAMTGTFSGMVLLATHKSQLLLVSVSSVDKHWIQTNSETMVLETLNQSVKVSVL